MVWHVSNGGNQQISVCNHYQAKMARNKESKTSTPFCIAHSNKKYEIHIVSTWNKQMDRRSPSTKESCWLGTHKQTLSSHYFWLRSRSKKIGTLHPVHNGMLSPSTLYKSSSTIHTTLTPVTPPGRFCKWKNRPTNKLYKLISFIIYVSTFQVSKIPRDCAILQGDVLWLKTCDMFAHATSGCLVVLLVFGVHLP